MKERKWSKSQEIIDQGRWVNNPEHGDVGLVGCEKVGSFLSKKPGNHLSIRKSLIPKPFWNQHLVYGDPVKVKVWFSYMKERKSKSQEIIDQEDGSIILSMETSGWWDVKRWVLSYGSEAKVLAPEDLRREIQ